MKRTLAVPEERRGEKHPVPIGGCQGRRAVVANTSLSCPIDSLTILSSLPMLPLNSPTKSTPHAEHDVGLAEEGKLAGSRGPGVENLGGNWKGVPRGGSGPNLKLTASIWMAAERRRGEVAASALTLQAGRRVLGAHTPVCTRHPTLRTTIHTTSFHPT